MKRLGALLLVLVLAMSVMPMGALAATSQVFYGWKVDGSSFDALTTTNAAGSTTWSDVNSGAITETDYKGVLVSGSDLKGDMDLSTWGGGDTLIVNGTPLTVASDAKVTVTAGDVYTLGTATIQLNHGTSGVTLNTNNGEFTGTMTIARTFAGSAAITTAGLVNAWSPGAPVVDVITVTNDSTISNYTQPGGSTFEVELAAGDEITLSNVTFNGDVDFASVTTVNGDFTIGKTGVASVTSETEFKGTITVYGTLNVEVDVGDGATFTNIIVENGGKLNVIENTGDGAVFTAVTLNGGTVDVNGPATFTAIEVNGGTVNIASTSSYTGNLEINGGRVVVDVNGTGAGDGASFTDIIISGGVLDFENNTGSLATINDIEISGGTMNINGELKTSFTEIVIDGGILNIGYATDLDTNRIDLTSGIMNVNVDTTIINGDFTVAAGGTLKVKDGVTLDLGSVNLIVDGKADFGTGGLLDGTGLVTVTGALYMKDPAVQVNTTNVKGSNFKGTGTIHTDHRTWFIRGYADSRLKYVGYSPLAISYGESILVNTPVLAPASSNYSGYGDFIINTSGLFSNFDPNESLYANNQKLQVGVDYEVNDKGGYAIFTIYESFMQSQSGPIVFRATFKNGYSGSTTVNAQSAVIPAEIGIDAPKTGTSVSAMGFALVVMAIALAAVVRKVKA